MFPLTQKEADSYFESQVKEIMAWEFPPVAIRRKEAESIVRGNIRWASKDLDQKIQNTIKKLYKL